MASPGRPKTYTDDTVVAVRDGKSNLQRRSERRAIVNYVIDNNGRATMGGIDEAFGYDIRSKVLALIRAGWLAVIEDDGTEHHGHDEGDDE